ncbi:MAG: hypothetical protein J4F42_16325 [Desulfurellaceae bacterium]|nr:hypothetical protein [Desulfurellaceae bacterium]
MTHYSIPADPLIRTRAVLAAVLTLALGLAALVYTQAYFNSMLELRTTHPRLAAAGLKQLYQVWAVSSGLVLGGLAGLLASFAVRVLRSGRVPPPGMRVVWTTRLRTDSSASLIAGTSLALAVGLLLGGLLLGHQLWSLALEYGVSYAGPFQPA